ncbi:hypothetical protein RE6C_03783 [Rhodopirellula europaea 6C]|uniref:Uncharacterized protein n=1 Tax=Rhodopirellula europaea 6C TaxID=1263867 RepID=M2AS43_9BACT|nr:hypothetical protein RE6C_03783 [Rhodopirellula europaea 6C]
MHLVRPVSHVRSIAASDQLATTDRHRIVYIARTVRDTVWIIAPNREFYPAWATSCRVTATSNKRRNSERRVTIA